MYCTNIICGVDATIGFAEGDLTMGGWVSYTVGTDSLRAVTAAQGRRVGVAQID